MLALFSCLQEMNTVPYLSKDQIVAAREMDLLTYLRRFEPEELGHIGGDTYATRTHDSLKISNGKWCWWSRGIGGTNALDYLTTVEGLSFLDAAQRILGGSPYVPTKSEPTEPLPKTEFTPALNALKALRGAPISMGRGEIPVGGCQPPSGFAIIYSEIITTYNFYYFGRYPHDR